MFIIKKTFYFVLILTIVIALLGCSTDADDHSMSQSNSVNSETGTDEKVKRRLNMLFEGTDIVRYEIENEKGTALSIYVTSALSGGNVYEKEEFVHTIAEAVKTATEEYSTSNIILYFKLASTKKLIYAYEKGKFINYE